MSNCDQPCQIAHLPAVKKGDTWDGMSVDMSSTGTSLAEALVSLRMSFWLAGADEAALELTSADGDITINDAAAWSYTVEPIAQVTLAAGQYSFEVETTSAAPRVKTYLTGTIEITPDRAP